MRVKAIRLAQRDIDQAAAHYRSCRVGLDEEFLQDVELAAVAISNSPHQFELVRRGMRRYILDRFPYSICYRIVSPDLVEIVVVRHHSRRPGFGLRRK